MSKKIWGDFQICISVPLILVFVDTLVCWVICTTEVGKINWFKVDINTGSTFNRLHQWSWQ